MISTLLATLTGLLAAARARVGHRLTALRAAPQRGDVPGWVLVTLMTAGLVVALWAVAGPLLVQLFTNAVNSVTGPS